MGKHKEWRKLAKKARRKCIRQKLAIKIKQKQLQEQIQREQSPAYQKWLKKYLEDVEFQEEEEKRIAKENEKKWLEIEKEAQQHWRETQRKLEEKRKERERRHELIRLEWEKEENRLKQLKEQKENELKERQREEDLFKEEIERFLLDGGSTPERLKTLCESQPNRAICPFFQKTFSCRFGDKCSRNHIKPGVSKIILIPNFYSHYSLERHDNEYGDTEGLEFENHETYQDFKEFFFDVIPELERCGVVKQFKVCCNRESHLRGNVYVEYSSTSQAVKSYQMFNGRWYGGRQLTVKFCRIESWKSAICGLQFKSKCPKGSACNFLHVFRNPNNLFCYYDEPKSPEKREWRWSESPERIDFSNNTHKHHHRNWSDDSPDFKENRRQKRNHSNHSNHDRKRHDRVHKRHKKHSRLKKHDHYKREYRNKIK